jgi:hypothetical protein
MLDVTVKPKKNLELNQAVVGKSKTKQKDY